MRIFLLVLTLFPQVEEVFGWMGGCELYHDGRGSFYYTLRRPTATPRRQRQPRTFLLLGTPLTPRLWRSPRRRCGGDCVSSAEFSVWVRQSSFYGDFENFDFDEEEEEDDDEEEEEEEGEGLGLDGKSLAEFRSKMDFLFDGGAAEDDGSVASAASAVDELIDFARSKQAGGGSAAAAVDALWAKVATKLEEGVVLLANPAKFCADIGSVTPNPALLSKFGLTMPPPAELGPDRRADLLPVLILVEAPMSPTDSSSTRRSNARMRGVLLNRRTGILLGDLEQPNSSDDTGDADDPGSGSPPRPLLEKFCIQPLWFGGVDNVSSGLDMLHQCPAVIGAKALTKDGLYWGGDPSQAQTAMEETAERVLTGFDFKFFVQSTVWSPEELEKQVNNNVWFLASVSKDLLFKPRDRMGTRRAKVGAVTSVLSVAYPVFSNVVLYCNLPLFALSRSGPSAWSFLVATTNNGATGCTMTMTSRVESSKQDTGLSLAAPV